MSARRPWGWPLVPLYAAVLGTKDRLRALGIARTRTLRWPVISVGSLSAGGAGKTPVVIALAELLRDRGWAIDVLSRGYGRTSDHVDRLDPDAADAAQRFGDEPVLISQRTGAPVWVGADRHAAGLAAEADPVAQPRADTRPIHLLDDGFQHRQLARTLDIVLVTAQDLEDALLPAGNRREPFAALERADLVLMREEEQPLVQPRIAAFLHPAATLSTIRRSVDLPALPVPGERVLAFSAIARPHDFTATLRAQGIGAVDSVAFPDHHRYTPVDITRIMSAFKSSGAEAFVTTEKDAVKLSPALRAPLEAVAPLLFARLHVEFLDPAAILSLLEARLS